MLLKDQKIGRIEMSPESSDALRVHRFCRALTDATLPWLLALSVFARQAQQIDKL